jgi:hypothetical protein
MGAGAAKRKGQRAPEVAGLIIAEAVAGAKYYHGLLEKFELGGARGRYFAASR